MPPYKKGIKLLESAQRRAMKMEKGLEGKVSEEQLRSLSLLSPGQRRLRGGFMAAAAPLYSLVTVKGPEGIAWSCVGEGPAGG